MAGLRGVVLGVLVGAVIGLIVYEVRSATGGTCPITCNPYVSVATGALMGLLISLARAGKQIN
jgi:hypothetical protein